MNDQDYIKLAIENDIRIDLLDLKDPVQAKAKINLISFAKGVEARVRKETIDKEYSNAISGMIAERRG